MKTYEELDDEIYELITAFQKENMPTITKDNLDDELVKLKEEYNYDKITVSSSRGKTSIYVKKGNDDIYIRLRTDAPESIYISVKNIGDNISFYKNMIEYKYKNGGILIDDFLVRILVDNSNIFDYRVERVGACILLRIKFFIYGEEKEIVKNFMIDHGSIRFTANDVDEISEVIKRIEHDSECELISSIFD